MAALVNAGDEGPWARSVLRGEDLVGPHLLPAEAASILRRWALAGDLTPDAATLAHGDLMQLPVVLFPYEPYARRVWWLRGQITAYDAWYVAVAEALSAPLATLDRRLARAQAGTCVFRLPPQTGAVRDQ